MQDEHTKQVLAIKAVRLAIKALDNMIQQNCCVLLWVCIDYVLPIAKLPESVVSED